MRFITRKNKKIKLGNIDHIYKELFHHYPDALFLLDGEGNFVQVNGGVERLTGYSKDEIVNSHIIHYIYEEDVEDAINFFNHVQIGIVQEKEFRIVDKERNMKCVSVSMVATDLEGEFEGITGVAKDITEKKKLESISRKKDELFESLIENSSDVIGILGENGEIRYQSQMVKQLLGYEPENLINTSCFDLIYHQDLDMAKILFEKVLTSPNETLTEEFRLNKANGDWIYCQANIKNLLHEEHVKGIVVNYRDISERKRYENKIEHIVFHDSLTGLPNRNFLERVLQNEMGKCKQVALLFVDLDRFKVINDNLGYNVGDQVLKKVTERIKSSVSQGDILFRQAGDKFFVFLPETDSKRAQEISEKILKNLSSPISINNFDIFISPSIGISLLTQDVKAAEQLVKHAEYAMYQAKKNGRNTFYFYSSGKNTHKLNPLRLEMDLHKAIEREELKLYYQPKINLKTGEIVGVEALIRWFHPELGMISPADFIPIAEETGLIIPIGKWALYQACIQNKQWQEQGYSPMVVSVNLSVRQFSQSSFIQTVAEALKESGLDPKYLELEVTESMTANIENTIHMLKQLKDLGVLISIDDFGTGFSSLNYLKEFPVDTLKIDQSFVRELQKSPNDQTIVKTIISMAHNLDLNVVAEGIETKDHLTFLQEHVCNEGQGYFFSRPLAPDELVKEFSTIETIISEHGIHQVEKDQIWWEESIREAKKELQDTLRKQQGMTLKFREMDGKFIHTLCEGELVYRLGPKPNEVVGRELKEFLPKNVAEDKEKYYQKAWNGEENVTYEGCISGIYYLAALRPIKRAGKVVEVIVSCIDITKRKEVEKDLRESEDIYRVIAENMSDLIGILDLNGEFIYSSPSFEKVLGKTPQKNLSFLKLIDPEDEELFYVQFTNMLQSKEPFSGNYKLKHGMDGKWILTETNFIPVTNGEKGQVKQVIVTIRDVTEQRQAEDLLWKFEKLSIIGELAAGVAHEIRNPITTIKGFVQLLQEGLYQSEYSHVMLKEMNQLEETLNEFLTLAKPQVNQVKPTLPEVIFENVVKKMSPEASLVNVEIKLDFERDLPTITCEPDQLKQVFVNLIKNSIEAMPDGGVVTIKGNQEKDHFVFKVIDEGVGISQERIERLGEPFYSNKEKGTGLGLMVCFRIIRDHKGMILVQSEESEGTTVEVRLPI